MPTWFAFLLALLGILTCLIAAQMIVPKRLQTDTVLPWVAGLLGPAEKKKSNPLPRITKTYTQDLNLDTKKAQEIQATPEPNVAEILSDCPPLFSFTFLEGSLSPSTFDADQKIVQLKEWLDLHPHHTVILEGYSDSSGTKDANLMLSYKRAMSVQNSLVEKGIPSIQLSVSAFGEDHLLEGIPSTSEKNRRVSMRIEGVLKCQ